MRNLVVMLDSRRLTEILRRGRRTLRKSLTRRSSTQDEESTSSVAHSSSLESTSSLDKVIPIVIIIINVSILSQPPAGATASNPSQPTPKEKVQRWIQARGKQRKNYCIKTQCRKVLIVVTMACYCYHSSEIFSRMVQR